MYYYGPYEVSELLLGTLVAPEVRVAEFKGQLDDLMSRGDYATVGAILHELNEALKKGHAKPLDLIVIAKEFSLQPETISELCCDYDDRQVIESLIDNLLRYKLFESKSIHSSGLVDIGQTLNEKGHDDLLCHMFDHLLSNLDEKVTNELITHFMQQDYFENDSMIYDWAVKNDEKVSKTYDFGEYATYQSITNGADLFRAGLHFMGKKIVEDSNKKPEGNELYIKEVITGLSPKISYASEYSDDSIGAYMFMSKNDVSEWFNIPLTISVRGLMSVVHKLSAGGAYLDNDRICQVLAHCFRSSKNSYLFFEESVDVLRSGEPNVFGPVIAELTTLALHNSTGYAERFAAIHKYSKNNDLLIPDGLEAKHQEIVFARLREKGEEYIFREVLKTEVEYHLFDRDVLAEILADWYASKQYPRVPFENPPAWMIKNIPSLMRAKINNDMTL